MLKIIPGIEESYSNKILSLFKQFPKCQEVILFGSRAKGNFREGSDIDLALKGAELTLDLREEILEKYEALLLPWKLDIVIYSLIQEPALREHIDRVGQSLIFG